MFSLASLGIALALWMIHSWVIVDSCVVSACFSSQVGPHVHLMEFFTVFTLALFSPAACGAHPFTCWVSSLKHERDIGRFRSVSLCEVFVTVQNTNVQSFGRHLAMTKSWLLRLIQECLVCRRTQGVVLVLYIDQLRGLRHCFRIAQSWRYFVPAWATGPLQCAWECSCFCILKASYIYMYDIKNTTDGKELNLS